MTADDAISSVRTKESAPALDEARQFLAGLVGPDGLSAKEIEKEAKEAGTAWATVRRAQEDLGYKSVRAGFGDGWVLRGSRDAHPLPP
jgi:hypothetical protein